MNKLTWLPLMALFACAQADEDDIAEDTAAVIQSPTTKSFAGVIQVNGCSGTVLTQHFLLTAAHCVPVTGTYFWITVSTALSSSGAPTLVYSGLGEAFRHPSYDGIYADHDIALIHLVQYGLETGTTGQTLLFSDARKPWRDNSLTAGVVAGFGLGSAPGGASTCASATSSGLLRAAQTRIYGYYQDLMVRTPTDMCPGDSGGPYYYRPTTTGTYQHIQIGVNWSGAGDGLATLIPIHLAWIQSTIQSRIPHRFSWWSWSSYLAGWRFLQHNEASGSVVGQFTHAGGWCLTASGAAQQGSPITLRPCDGSWAQWWSLSPTGEIRTLATPGMCMDVQWGKTENGTPLWLWPCSYSVEPNAAQRFRVEADGTIHTGLDHWKCVDLLHDSAYDGAPLQVWDCNWSAAQTFPF